MSEDQAHAVDDYIIGHLLAEDDALAAALAASEAEGLPSIAVAPNQGKLLQLLARLAGARRILEVGTLGGYSTIWLARALPEDGRLITLERNPVHARVAEANLARAGLADRVEVRVGPALDSLAQLAADGAEPFDFSFIDADKGNNPDYFAWALRLSHQGSVIVVDNVVRQGAVIDAGDGSADVRGTRRLFEVMGAEALVDATAVQTLGLKGHDGFAIALVTGQP